MNFDQRVEIAVQMLGPFLSRYTAPKHLDNHGKAQIVRGMSEALARKLPLSSEEGYRDNIARAFEALADAHESYAWPPQGLLVKAISKIAPNKSSRAPETFSMNWFEVEAGRMDRGEAVSESFIWGQRSFPPEIHVDGQQLARYRKASIENHLKIYGQDGLKVLSDRYGDVVYSFSAVAAQ